MNFLGQFLISRGFIDENQLGEALAHQREQYRPVGVLAVERGWLTPEQVNEILEIQKREDRFFGQIALSRGWLVEEQLDEVLAHQRRNKVLVGEALLALGHIGAEDLVAALNEYTKLEQGLQLSSRDIVYSADNSEFLMLVLESAASAFERFAGARLKLQSVWREPSAKADLYLLTGITLLDRQTLEYALGFQHGLAEKLAVGGRLRQESGGAEEALQTLDAVVRGYLVTRLAERDFEIHETSDRLLRDEAPEAVSSGLRLRLVCQHGEVLLGFRVLDMSEEEGDDEDWVAYEAL